MSRYRADTPPVSSTAGAEALDQLDYAGSSSFVPSWSAFSGLGASGFNILGVGGGGAGRDTTPRPERDAGGSSWRRSSLSRERDRGPRESPAVGGGYSAGDSAGGGSSWSGPASFASRLRFTHRMSGISSSPSARSSASQLGASPRRRLAARHLVVADHLPSSHHRSRSMTSGSSRVPLVAMTLAPTSRADARSVSPARSPTRRLAVAGRREARVLRIDYSQEDGGDGGAKIEEIIDLRASSQSLGPGYGTNDLSWGYEYTGEKIAMACTNGAVVCFDLQRADSKIEVIKFEHTRAVNRVAFGAPGGNWLVSGAHDGFAKLWDLRDHGPAQLFVQTHGDPIRHLRFHPDRTGNPFSLAVLSDTGALFTYDLRSAGKGAISRIAAHVGAGLGLDWRVSPSSSSESVSWLASGGVDGTVKVWDMSPQTGGTPGLLRTLHVVKPVQDVAWRPERPLELAVAMMEGGMGGGVAGSAPSTLRGGGVGSAASIGSDEAAANMDGEDGREGDFEIWDLRRDAVPKFVVRGRDGPASTLLWSSTDALLTTHKRTSCLVQHDVAHNPECPLDDLPRQAMAWSAEGTLAFAVDEENWDEIPFDDASHSWSLDPFTPEAQAPAITNALPPSLDLASSPATFRFLALNSILSGQPFSALCDHNAAVARDTGRLDLWRIWKDVGVWFADGVVSSLPPEQDGALRKVEKAASVQGSQASKAAWRRMQQSTSASPRRRAAAREAAASSSGGLSRSRSRPPSRYNSPRLAPVRSREVQSSTEGLSSLGDFDEEASETQSTQAANGATGQTARRQQGPKAPPREPFPHLTKTESSDDEDETQPANAARLALSLGNLRLERPSIAGRQRSASLLGSGAPTPKAIRPAFLPLDTISAAGSVNGNGADEAGSAAAIQPSSSSDSELSAVATGQARKEAIQRRVARRDQALNSRRAPTPAGTARVAGVSDVVTGDRKRPRRSVSKDRIAAKIHRRGASSSDLGSLMAALGSSGGVPSATVTGGLSFMTEEVMNSLRWRAFERRAEVELNKTMQDRLRAEIRSLAAHGDVQAAFMLNEVVGPRIAVLAGDEKEAGVGMAEKRGVVEDEVATRWAMTYIRMLDRHRLFALAAEVRKRSRIEYITNTSLGAAVRTVAACGRCKKAMEDPAPGVCPRCRADFLQCMICHLPVHDEPLAFCATCHHAAHRGCISSYLISASALGHALAASLARPGSPVSPTDHRHLHGGRGEATPTPPATGASSPGWVGSWFWGETQEALAPLGTRPLGMERDGREWEGLECPSGCGHRDCLSGWLAVAGIA